MGAWNAEFTARAHDRVYQWQKEVGEPPAQSAQTMNVAELVAAATATLTGMEPAELSDTVRDILDENGEENSRFHRQHT